MNINHEAYQLALRNRAALLAVVPAPDWADEDIAFTPRAGFAYIREQYVPGPAPQVTLAPVGTGGEIEVTGFYILQIFAPEGAGISGAGKYATGLLNLFPPGLSLVASNGETVRIRSNPIGPNREQLRRIEGGRSMIPVNIPFRVRTLNN